MEYEKTREVSAGLRTAREAAGRVPGTDSTHFWSVCVHLLDWWEGRPFGADREQKECTKRYDLKHPWVQAFKIVVETTAELSVLAEWNGGHFRFRTGVGQDVRRGIKNYVREHREHVVES